MDDFIGHPKGVSVLGRHVVVWSVSSRRDRDIYVHVLMNKEKRRLVYENTLFNFSPLPSIK